jgi:hypothetical protein
VGGALYAFPFASQEKSLISIHLLTLLAFEKQRLVLKEKAPTVLAAGALVLGA